jgi:hydroxymethylglutaryl-CoA synthase
MGVYVPGEVLLAETLAEARNTPVEKLKVGLGMHEMAVVPPWEDTVSLAANAGLRALGDGVSPDEIGLCIVGTESGIDHSKAAAIFVHELLGLPSTCRTYEVKHACYGGTAALQTACDWIASGSARGRKALVIAADIAKYPPESAGEPTQGAGAVAMVVSANPAILEFDRSRVGIFAEQVHDFWRPLDMAQALVDGKYSLDCYLDALAGAFDDYRVQAEAAGDLPKGEGVLLDRFARFLYHTPFPKMAWKAHAMLAPKDWQSSAERAALLGEDLAAAVKADYAERVDGTLWASRRIGNTYTASMYFGLAATLEREAVALVGKELAFFSYGSGCCSEFFTGRVLPGAPREAEGFGLEAMLDARRRVEMAEYERHHGKTGLRGVESPEVPGAEFAGPFFYAGTVEDKRIYKLAAAAEALVAKAG